MAANLVKKAGRSLLVWNRDTAKAEAFVKEHPSCSVASSPKEVVDKCALTYSMISNLEASKAVFEGDSGLLAGVAAGKTIVDCATLTPERMSEMSAAVVGKGGRFLEAPVSGSKMQALNGILIMLCAGDKAVFDEITVDLDAMGKASFYFGDVGAGSKAKLVVNVTMGSMITTLAEGMHLTKAAGLSQETLLEVLGLGACNSPIFTFKGPCMVKEEYPTMFPLKHQQKDMGFALDLAAGLDVDMPVATAANSVYVKAMEKGKADDDCGAVYEANKK